MTSIDILTNYNGKLFSDIFPHVTLFSHEFKEAYNTDAEIKIMTRGTEWGKAKILDLVNFPFRDLKNSISYLSIGKSSLALAYDLNRMHNQGKTLPPDTMLSHLVLAYTERNFENQDNLIREWWEDKKLNAIV